MRSPGRVEVKRRVEFSVWGELSLGRVEIRLQGG
jgi:hypothetical protein